MLAPPADLTDADVVRALWEHYAIEAVSMSYLAVGFGSHHWLAEDPGGGRWFVTVDDLASKRRGPDEAADDIYRRLRAAFSTALDLRRQGLAFVVAPVETAHGEALARLTDAYAISLTPHLNGAALGLGDYWDDEERRPVLELLAALHHADPAATPLLLEASFELPHREDLEAALGDLDSSWTGGPFSEPARAEFRAHGDGVRRLLEHHNDLARRAEGRPSVVTHGEPHRGNVMRVDGRLMLIDWDTALLAPPERDLWMVCTDGGAAARRYQDMTGYEVAPWMLDLYRLHWDLAEIALYVGQFREPHEDDPNMREAWKNLGVFLRPVERWPKLFE